jgi:DeoR family fructose operon transcriptional repressor
MLQIQREARILDLLKSKRIVALSEIQALLKVSRMTIWRDIQRLAPRHGIQKVHGGIMMTGASLEYIEDSMEKRSNVNPRKKTSIAKKAAKLIHEGQTIALDPSSSSLYLARELGGFSDLRVITNCLEVAAAMRTHVGLEVLMTGGILKSTTSSLTGPQVAAFFKDVTVDLFFFSATGISADHTTLLDINPLEVEAKKAMISSARASVLLFDSGKLSIPKGNLPIIKLKDVDEIVSDRKLALRSKRRKH